MTTTLPTRNPLDNISYEDLYRRWEMGNWRATELDFTRRPASSGRTTSPSSSARPRCGTTRCSSGARTRWPTACRPTSTPRPLEEQKYFLATQQVDEARHAVFFNRFMHEVAGIGDGTMAGGLDAIKPQLTWGFTKVFDRLVTMSDELRRDPSIPRLAAAITLYHVIIEAALAQPGQHFITSYLAERDTLPGFRAGMENVAADEQRHIGFGVKLLSDLREMDPEVPHAVADLLREVIPWTASVLVPPDWDMRYVECFGFTLDDIGEEGAVVARHQDAHAPGCRSTTCPGPPVFPVPGTPRERSQRGRQMVRAGYLGEKLGPPSTDPDDMRVFFDVVAGGAAGRRAPASRARSSGTSPTPSRGTWWWPTATPAPSAERPTRRACACARASRTSST